MEHFVPLPRQQESKESLEAESDTLDPIEITSVLKDFPQARPSSAYPSHRSSGQHTPDRVRHPDLAVLAHLELLTFRVSGHDIKLLKGGSAAQGIATHPRLSADPGRALIKALTLRKLVPRHATLGR